MAQLFTLPFVQEAFEAGIGNKKNKKFTTRGYLRVVPEKQTFISLLRSLQTYDIESKLSATRRVLLLPFLDWFPPVLLGLVVVSGWWLPGLGLSTVGLCCSKSFTCVTISQANSNRYFKELVTSGNRIMRKSSLRFEKNLIKFLKMSFPH